MQRNPEIFLFGQVFCPFVKKSSLAALLVTKKNNSRFLSYVPAPPLGNIYIIPIYIQ